MTTTRQHAPEDRIDTGAPTCTRCHHDNADVRIIKTLFRRRVVAECSFIEEPISGMAGHEVCSCRGPAHQTVITG